jgi:hypothetical protein
VVAVSAVARRRSTFRFRRGAVLTTVVGLVAAYGVANPSWASAATLSGSNFEIDTNANLVVDGASPAIDWLNSAGTAMRDGVEVGIDRPTGQDDDSFTQGTNINDTPTTITTGSIPNSKSDLKSFGIYVDKAGSEPFVDVFWGRVQDPHGTTTMDFEFNQSAVRQNDISPPHNTDVDTHTIPLRTPGDVLVTYFLESSGDTPVLTWRKWDGSKWGASQVFSASDALASINSSAISAANSDGVGPFDPYTFGEASLRLATFVPPTGQCVTFGSVYLRSRSSATDTDEIKDFIAPKPVTISNCGSIKIHKTDDNGVLKDAGFTIYKDASPFGGSRDAGDTVVAGTCSTNASGDCTVSDLKLGHYWVVETTVPAGHDAAPDRAVEITEPDEVFTVNLNDPIQHGHIVIIKNAVPDDPQDFTFTLDGANGVTLDDDPQSATPNSHDYTVVVGEHTVVETNIPSDWVNTGLVCNDNNPTSVAKPTAVVNVSKNETVTCTYTNTYTPKGPSVATTAAAAVANTSWNDTATVTGDGVHPVTGTVSFYVCGPTVAAADCNSTANQVGSAVAVNNGSATTSVPFTPTEAGWYCFRAEFDSGDSPYYTDASHTNSTTECFLKRNANLTVSKTATPAFGRAYTWDVEKSVVGDDSVSVPAGTTHSFDYQVSVTHSSTDSSWTVTGVITVNNPNGVAFTGVNISDQIDNGAGTCQVQNATGVTVPANGSVQRSYTCTYASAPSSAKGTNTATATWNGATYFTTESQAQGTAPVDFDSVEPSTTDQLVTVSDSLKGKLGDLDGDTAENPTVYTYSIEQTAPQGTCTTVPNTAVVTTVRPQAELVLQGEPITLDSSSASVTICGGLPLGVDQTAGGGFDRDYLWLIDKSVDQTKVTLPNGQSATFNYTVKVTPNGTVDSGYTLAGTVSVTNPNDFEDIVADVTVTSDLGGGVLCAVVDGADAVIPKSDGATFAYTCSFTGTPLLTGSMTATVTWDAAAAATAVDNATDILPVSLELLNETHKTITVTDDKTDPANPVELGTAAYGDGEKSFTYSLTKAGVPGTAAAPGCATYTNIAMIVETEQSDTQDVELCHTFTGGGGTPVVNPPQGGGLPFTGDGIGLLAREAIGLILAGGLLLFLTRKKRLAQ